MKRGFDGRCYELAEYFLSGEAASENAVRDLAQSIQDVIEDWIEFEFRQKAKESAP